MTTDIMIRQLRYTAKKHENDKLHTFDTNISLMCTEVANRLEEIEKEKSEIRNKAIEEFLSEICKKYTAEEAQGNYQHFCVKIKNDIAKIAESMKGEKE